MKKDSIRFEVVSVTPQLATEWLETNRDNRHVSDPQVAAFARVMSAGGWRVNNQAIAFDENGCLIDGQHRLWAVIQAGIAVRMTVAHGVELEAVKTIDRGRTRSVEEVLRREGTVTSPKRVSMWCNAQRQLLTNSTTRGCVEDVEAYFEENQRALGDILAALPDVKPWKPAMIGATFVFAHRRAARVVVEFVRRMVDGSNLEAESPEFVARELIHATSGNARAQRRQLGIKLLRCIQAAIKGETMRRGHVYATESALHFFQTTKGAK